MSFFPRLSLSLRARPGFVSLCGWTAITAGVAPANAVAGPQCIDEVETYRSLVIHQGGDTTALVQGDLPTGEIADFDDLPIPASDPFWEAFSIDRTLEQLALTDPLLPEAPTEADVDARVQAIVDSFLATQTLDDQFLPDEAGFRVDGGTGSVDLFDLVPVALFNRMDLAANNGVTCGEHRIVYRDTTNSSALVIFEARILNPLGTLHGSGGCLPLARHWAAAGALALPDSQTGAVDTAALTTHMEALFYEGVGPFDSAIHYNHLGGVVGQVRGNAIFGWTPVWSLREWQLGSAVASGLPELRSVSVKDNAFAELLALPVGQPAPGATGMSDADWAEFQAAFLDHWTDDILPNLLSPEDEGIDLAVADGRDFLAAIRVGVLDEFNEFQSVSQPVEFLLDDASEALLDAVSCWLAPDTDGCAIVDPVDGLAPGLTADHVVNRYVRAGSCAGCHQVGASDAQRAVAPGVLWPRAGSFVHVSGASGNLSPALHGSFLPVRSERLLDRFAEASPGDVNFDGIVNAMDLIMVLGDWSTDAEGADANCDGTVNTMDLLEVLAGWSSPVTGRLADPSARLHRLERDARMARSPLERRRALQALREEQTALRATEAAVPGSDGRVRPPH